MDIRIYVITHKSIEIPKIPGYVSLLAGASLRRVEGSFDEKDNVGIHISERNRSFCELTGLYWIWKNSDADVVGVSHYRRFFSRRELLADEKYFLREKDIAGILMKHRLIVPKKFHYGSSVLQAINYAPNIIDMKELYQAILVCAPDYESDYRWYLRQNQTYFFNMCIMKKDDFDAYCSWLFPILFYFEKLHSIDRESNRYRKRLFGFVAERLLPVWIHHNVHISEIAEMPLINTDESLIIRIRRWAGNYIREFRYRMTRYSSRVIERQRVLEKFIFE